MKLKKIIALSTAAIMLTSASMAVIAAVEVPADAQLVASDMLPPDTWSEAEGWNPISEWRYRVGGVAAVDGPNGHTAFEMTENSNTVRGFAKGFGDVSAVGAEEGVVIGPNLDTDVVAVTYYARFNTRGGGVDGSPGSTTTTEVALVAVPNPVRDGQSWGVSDNVRGWHGGEVIDMVLRVYQGSFDSDRYPGHLFIHAGEAGRNWGGDQDRRNNFDNWDLGHRIDPAANAGLYYYPAGSTAADIWYRVVKVLNFATNSADVSITNLFNNYTYTATVALDPHYDRIDVIGAFLRHSGGGYPSSVALANLRVYTSGAAVDTPQEPTTTTEEPAVTPTAPPAATAAPQQPTVPPTNDNATIAFAVVLGGLLVAAVVVLIKKRQTA